MVSISDYLRDFGAPDDVRASRRAQMALVGTRPAGTAPAAEVQQVPEADFEAVAAEAFERGRRQALVESAEQHASDLEAEQARHREEMEAMRSRYEQDYASTIATRFDRLSSSLAGTIGSQVADTLAPFLDNIIRDRVVARLAQSISDSMVDGETAEIDVSGPRGLYEQLSMRMAASDVVFAFTESDDVDLSVSFNGTLFATRLTEWSEALKEALA